MTTTEQAPATEQVTTAGIAAVAARWAHRPDESEAAPATP